jgi:hypothetical protein
VLLEPVITDWGWESAMLAGPGGVVINLYRELVQRDSPGLR